MRPSYTPPGGTTRDIGYYDGWIQKMYADLVAAIHIGRAYQAKCERLEAQVQSLAAVNHSLIAELDRLELVSR